MAGRISPQDIDAIKSRANIADVIGDYVQLKSASVGSLKGLCPFHDEKSPSFNVRPAQGFYNCFGCGEGGDVYKFLQKIDSLSFYEAVEKLASRIGYTITYVQGSAPNSDGINRARILEANAAAAAWFQSELSSAEAETGRAFLAGRGFDKAAAELFSIGYAPKGWSGLLDVLKLQGFNEAELIKADLAVAGQRGVYDKFRGRLIWPIRDTSGATIGFGARKLYDDDQGPKYLNSSETQVYHKSQVLYGVDLAKRDIAKRRQVVVVEGYTDVMACHLAGITTAVATCGTAFGDDHIRRINQMFGTSSDGPAEVIFTFDPDAAGQKAAMRAFEDSTKFIASTFVAKGPDGLDPCDLRMAKGDSAVVQMVADRRPIYEFALSQKIAGHDLSSYAGRIAAARAAVGVLVRITDLGARNQYLRQLSEMISIAPAEIEPLVAAELQRKRAADVTAARRGENTFTPAEQMPPEPDDHVEFEEFIVPNGNDPATRFELRTLEALVQVPQAFETELATRVLNGLFGQPSLVMIAHAAAQSMAAFAATNWVATIAANTPPPLHDLLRSLLFAKLPVATEDDLMAYGKQIAAACQEKLLARDKAALIAALANISIETHAEAHSQIQQQLVEIENQRRALKDSL